MCWSKRSLVRWQPQQSQVHHGSDGPGYLERTPTCTGPLSGPFRVRIEAWQRWGGVGQSFPEDLVRSKSRMFCDRNKTMMMQNSRTVRRSVDANEQARERAKTTPLRNEAQLNCVSLRSQLDCEVTGGAVKGQDERPFRAPLTAPPATTGSIQHGRELALGGLNTRKTDKNRGAVGRASCQSSLLSDPNAKFSAEMWRKPQRTRKLRRAATSALTFMTFS